MDSELKTQLNRIEDKLDNHLERIAKVEANVGSMKWVLGLMISTVGTFAVYFLDKFTIGH